MEKIIKLPKKSKIVAVVPENTSGAGWANQIFRVYYLKLDSGNIGVCYLQPKEWCQSPELSALFKTGAAINEDMIRAADLLLGYYED